MSCSSTLTVLAYDQPYTLVIEPWADEFTIQVGNKCKVVALHPSLTPTFSIEMAQNRLVATINEGSSTYEFWRGDVCEFSNPVPIPGAPHFS